MGNTLLTLFLLSAFFSGTADDIPRATLTAGTTIIPVGSSVTLTCSVESSDGWKYEWFRRTQRTSEVPIRDQQNRDIRVSQGGIYRCRGTRRNPVYHTDKSDDVTIEITFVVKQQPNWPQIFRGETITLTCEVQEGGETTEWEYEWRGPRTSKWLTRNDGWTFIVSESSSGDYMCKSRRRDDSYSSTEWSEAFTLSVSNKPTLTAGTTIIPVGGSVTLTCSVQSSAQWKYEWFRRTQRTSEVPVRDQQNRDIRVSEGGIYRCRGTRRNPVYYTDISDDVTIEITHKPTLTAGTTIIPVGGSVTLTCSLQSSDGWKYEWFRRTQRTSEVPVRDQQNRDIRVTQGGIYSCRGTRRNPVYYTDISDDVTIEKTLSNKVVVKQQPNWPQIFRGETITLTCEVQEGGETTEWEYEWRGPRTSKRLTRNDGWTFIVSESSSGDYMCKSRRRDDSYSSTEWSEAFTLSVSNIPRATLTAGTTIIPVGGSVTLTCSVESSDGWKYEWFRRTQRTSEVPIRDQQNKDIRVSQGGIYSCRGARGNPVYYTYESYETIEITFSNKVVVKQRPNWPPIFRGEKITLTCEVQEGGETTEWEYEWRGPRTSKWLTRNDGWTFIVSESSSGDYMCKSRRRDDSYSSTEWSEAFTLSVSNKPRPVLTVSPSWLSPGASVTLNCEVEHPSAGWSFYWYKAVPDLSEKSSSYELLPDGSGTAQDSYIIHGQTHTAGYVCRAGRGDPEYHTDHSQPKFVWSKDAHSAASLTVSPDRVQHFTSDSVSLTCEGNFTEWRVRKFSEDGRLYSDCRRMTGSTCNINTSKSDTAVYWCESGSGEFSNAVNITVQSEYELYETAHHSGDTANGDHHIYETIQDLEDTANEEDESPEATYSLIEVKDLGKHHKPHTSTLYTDVNMGTAGQ
ncbi:unnamed protein product [Oreochromis niloticus]|nr:unnamed protein product [Mustela putorius furo]